MNDLVSADRKGHREVDGHLVKQRAREHLAERDPHERGAHPEQQRLKAQDQQHLAGVEALHAQVGDEAPALGDREQHRVDGEQEADHRADRGEQRGRLVRRLRGGGEQAQFVVRRLDVQASAGKAPKLAGHQPVGARQRLHQHFGHPSGLCRRASCASGSRGDRDRAVRGRIRRARRRARCEPRWSATGPPASSVTGFPRRTPIVLATSAGRPTPPVSSSASVLGSSTAQDAEPDDVRVHADQLDRLATTGTDDDRVLSQERGRDLHTGQPADRAGQAARRTRRSSAPPAAGAPSRPTRAADCPRSPSGWCWPPAPRTPAPPPRRSRRRPAAPARCGGAGASRRSGTACSDAGRGLSDSAWGGSSRASRPRVRRLTGRSLSPRAQRFTGRSLALATHRQGSSRIERLISSSGGRAHLTRGSSPAPRPSPR